MKTRYFTMGLVALALAAVVVLADRAQASDVYKFTIRGQVTEVDRANKTVTIYTTYTATEKAKNDLPGNTFEFNASGARYYKYDAKGKKVRTTIGNVPVQAEVVVKGAKRAEGRYNISELTVNPSSFSLVGTVQAHDKSNKIITVEVSTSTYKETSIKGKDIKVYYGNNTTFRNKDLGDINSDELANNKEKVKVTGTVTNGWKYEATSVIDGYEKTK